MSMKTNCPNCGAPIESERCPYCGTIIYDFANVSFDKPSYIRLKVNNRLYVFKAWVTDMTVHQDLVDMTLDISMKILEEMDHLMISYIDERGQ